jgi:hypothetical protein
LALKLERDERAGLSKDERAELVEGEAVARRAVDRLDHIVDPH